MILFDTSAALALVDSRDPNHSRAARYFEDTESENDPFLTHNYVITEATALIQRRIGLAQAIRFQDQIIANIEIHWVTSAEHHVAFEILRLRNRRRLSLVDCVSFLVMQKYRCNTAFAYDSDFETEGFNLVG